MILLSSYDNVYDKNLLHRKPKFSKVIFNDTLGNDHLTLRRLGDGANAFLNKCLLPDFREN